MGYKMSSQFQFSFSIEVMSGKFLYVHISFFPYNLFVHILRTFFDRGLRHCFPTELTVLKQMSHTNCNISPVFPLSFDFIVCSYLTNIEYT